VGLSQLIALQVNALRAAGGAKVVTEIANGARTDPSSRQNEW
jgi:hypothetical protein